MDLSQITPEPVLQVSLSLNGVFILAAAGLLMKYLHDRRTGKHPPDDPSS